MAGLVALAVALTGGDGPEPGGDVAAPSAPAPTEGEPTDQQAAALALERRDPDDPLAMGPVDAPVAMVVFSDYQCPFCAAWTEQTLPAMQEYAEAGDLRIEWRDVNILDPDVSVRASRAAYAAGLQGGFWDYHELLFPDGETRAAAELTDDGLVSFAAELGLDEDRFAEDMAAADTIATIDHNAQEGLDAGAFSTPSFVVGGQPLVGAQPTQVFVDAVEQALASGS